MKLSRRMLFFNTRVCGAAVLCLSAAACDDAPLGPRPLSWREAGAFPPDTREVAAVREGPGGAVYACGAAKEGVDTAYAAVYKYAGNDVVEIFRSPYPQSRFSGLEVSNGALYAVGWKPSGSAVGPYFVKYDGLTWEEVDVPGSLNARRFGEVRALNDNFLWVVSDAGLFSYQGGFWRRHIATASMYDEMSVEATPNGTTCVLYRNAYTYEALLYTSPDAGASWRQETVALDEGYYRVADVDVGSLANGGEAVFISCSLIYNIGDHNIENGGIITKEDASDVGFSISFMTPHGPHYYGVGPMAFLSPTDGYAVGSLTSVALEGGEWILEQVPDGFPDFEAITAGTNAYWAVTQDIDGGPWALWRAP